MLGLNNEKIIIKFYLNNKAFTVKKLFKKTKLSEVRNELEKKQTINFDFIMKEGFIIEREEEKDFLLSEIIDENRVYI